MTGGQRATLDLNKIFSAAQLPALPQSAIRLLEISQAAGTMTGEFAVPIESDPGLASQVLRFVNSSYFGFAGEISSVKTALALVGIRTIKNFALWSAVFSLMPNPKCGPFDLKSLWQDSLRRAMFARAIGKLLKVAEPEDLFAAALLQDMAVPVLAKEAPELYVRLLESSDQLQMRLSTLEQQLFGWSHAVAAGMMARRWNLPEQFAILIENHVALDCWAAEAEKEPAKLAVALSALLPSTSDSGWHECAELEATYEKVTPAGRPAMAAVLARIDEEFGQFAPILKVATPAKSLLDRYQEVAVGAA